MKRLICALFATVAISAPATAADEWGIEHERTARFEAKVVDILCELTGDCPADCGGGRRQLGLLRDDGTLVLAAKNADPFAGTAADLIGFCGKRVVADGLYIADPLMPMFALQFVRRAPDGKWRRANGFVRRWAEANEAETDGGKGGSWFRHDPIVKEVIEKDGVFGIPGLKAKE